MLVPDIFVLILVMPDMFVVMDIFVSIGIFVLAMVFVPIPRVGAFVMTPATFAFVDDVPARLPSSFGPQPVSTNAAANAITDMVMDDFIFLIL